MSFRASRLVPGARRRMPSRRGSALLIVLGMLAFMIISAVAFSAYMRYSRMPSNFLRRTSSSRLLVKAALARAIDEIDASIGNNPHPGVGTVETRYPRSDSSNAPLINRNIWLHRVFFGTNGYCSAENTVSPLTLEGLAYIPPPLVNEARYFSRLSPAAAWRSLGFDTGRYAFCALDVSDYFDVNRIFANTPRSSAANRRISLSYLFERGEDHSSAGSGAKEWDNWMKKFRDIDDETLQLKWSGDSIAPLISLADFNLALGPQKFGDMFSPFYRFIMDTNGQYVKDQDDGLKISNMPFVTDGLFPPDDETISSATETYDLADSQYQPFSMSPTGNNKVNPGDIIGGTHTQHEGEMKWYKRLGGVGLVALWDYLDPDHIPSSLAVPTTERTPMICAMQPFQMMEGMKLAIAKSFQYPENNGQHGNQKPISAGGQDGDIGTTRVCEQTVYYRLKQGLIPPAGSVRTLVAFPFAHDAEYSKKFKIDGRISFFFSTENMSLRTNNSSRSDEVLHITEKGKLSTDVDSNTGLMNIELSGDLKFDTKNAPSTEEEALQEVNVEWVGPAALENSLGNTYSLVEVAYKWTQTLQATGQQGYGAQQKEWTPTLDDMVAQKGWTERKVTSQLCIVNKNGVRQTNLEKFVDGGTEIQLNAAVWMRIKEQGGDAVVDMVPACLMDDVIENPDGGANEMDSAALADSVGSCFPLMRFDTEGQGQNVRLNLAQLDTMVENNEEKEIKMYPQCVMVGDPRFNHAPENWFVASDVSKQKWLDDCQARERDGDIFMEVSDAGYLQSKYELAMLPACADLSPDGGDINGNMPNLNSWNSNTFPQSFGQTVQSEYMWRTYDPARDDAANFDKMLWVAGKSGSRVNPYSDSTNVIMAAFANTPINWSMASTNETDDAEHVDYGNSKDADAEGFNAKYAWNAYNSDAEFRWADLEGIAGKFMEKVRANGSNWEAAWNQLDWVGTDDTFCDVKITGNNDIWSVDRKFFYGFWKDCFAAKQQLFLVFVRAEPAMMGGGSMGQIPPQLGARAVALVWRNPATKKRNGEALDEDAPHQTRVLFYRQLD